MSSLDKTTSNFMRSLCMGEILEDLIKAAFEDARKKVEASRAAMEKDLMGCR